jgi:hypothetical protein
MDPVLSAFIADRLDSRRLVRPMLILLAITVGGVVIGLVSPPGLLRMLIITPFITVLIAFTWWVTGLQRKSRACALRESLATPDRVVWIYK